MSTYSKVSLQNSPIAECFLTLYTRFTAIQKKIFIYLYRLAKKFRIVFPSIERIALECGCSSRTVTRFTNFLEQIGVLSKKKIAYRSSEYYFVDEILAINIFNPRVFLKPNVGTDVGVSNKYLYLNEGTLPQGTAHKCAQISKELRKTQDIPYALKEVKGLEDHERIRLACIFSEAQIIESIRNMYWYISKGNTVKSIMGMLYNGCRYAFKEKSKMKAN